MTSATPPQDARRSDPTDEPPYFRSWRSWYGLVLLVLALLVVAFALFGRVYS